MAVADDGDESNAEGHGDHCGDASVVNQCRRSGQRFGVYHYINRIAEQFCRLLFQRLLTECRVLTLGDWPGSTALLCLGPLTGTPC